MRRRGHDGGIGRLCRQRVDAREMKAADAAGLVATRTGDVVQAARKPPTERMFCSVTPSLAAFFRHRDDIFLRDDRVVRTLAFRQAERRLQFRRRKSVRRRSDRALGQKLFAYRTVPRSSSAKCLGSSSHALKSRLSFLSARYAAVDLVFQRRLFKRARLRVVAEHLEQVIRCGNRGPPILAHARSED